MAIDTAVLLAAGMGSRLRPHSPLKPLCPVAGRALIDHAIEGMAAAGMRRVIVVLGYEAPAIVAHLARRSWPAIVETVLTADYRQPNGVSVLAAAPLVAGADALLAMCDHLVDPHLYAHVAAAGTGGGATLGIDRRLGHPWVDMLDVTRVRTAGDRIVGIGKEIAGYDCFDTGVFAIGPALFDALARLEAPSLTEGMRALAAEDRARVVDCSGFDWIDVDDASAHALAEKWLAHAA